MRCYYYYASIAIRALRNRVVCLLHHCNDVGEYGCGSNLLCSLLLFVQINFRLFNAKCDQSTISFQLSMTAFHRQTVISLFPFIRAARQDGRVCSLLLFVQFNFRQFNAN